MNVVTFDRRKTRREALEESLGLLADESRHVLEELRQERQELLAELEGLGGMNNLHVKRIKGRDYLYSTVRREKVDPATGKVLGRPPTSIYWGALEPVWGRKPPARLLELWEAKPKARKLWDRLVAVNEAIRRIEAALRVENPRKAAERVRAGD